MKLPEHPPRFETIGLGAEAVEVSLTYDEVLEWLRINSLPATEDGAAQFTTVWYLHYREQGYRDEYMEIQMRDAFDAN